MLNETNLEVTVFFAWWQFSVCAFAFLALMAIWYHIGRKQQDFGQVWLAISILCWSFSGLAEIGFVQNNYGNTGLRNGLQSIFSLGNSLFILLALPWFRYLPNRFETLIQSKYWRFVVGVPFLFALLSTIFKMFSESNGIAIKELDVFYALLTLIFLGFVLWESFQKRRLPLLAWLSLVTILVTLVAQLYKLIDESVSFLLFSAIFKTALIMLFFALALSWVKELIETVIPSRTALKLRFQGRGTAKESNKYRVDIGGFPGGEDRQVALTPTLYQLLKLFAERKLTTDEGWLEIRPKNFNTPKTYDIKDYNEVKRLLDALLDGLLGKGNWSKEKHFLPLKSVLFEMSEMRERKIRLAIPSENVTL